VTVGDPYGSARTLGQAKRVAAIVVNVTVHDVVWAVYGNNTSKVLSVAPWPARVKTWKNSTAEGTNFVIVRTWLCSVNQEIQLKTLAVNTAQNVHKPCLDSAAAHSADDL
jgi:hypothetical protein